MNSGPELIGTNIHIFPGTVVDSTASIGHGTVIGFPSIDLADPAERDLPETIIAANVRIGCFCVIEAGAQLNEGVKVDHFVRVGPGTEVGEGSYLLYGTRLHCDVRIGKRCRVSGNCPDRTVIEDDVTHFGWLHHEYSSPMSGWDNVDEPSPYIGARSVVGARAIVIGGVRIGRNVYIAAGEVVRTDVPDRSVVHNGRIIPGREWRGRLKDSGFFEWGADQ